MPLTKSAVCLLLTSLFTLPLPAAALINGQPPAEDDTRFDAVGSFSHSRWLGLDPEHPNAKDHNWYGNATLIAPDVVILARHLIKGKSKPPVGEYGVRFRRLPDGSIGSKKAGPASYHNVKITRFVTAPGADLALAILETPVEHIEPMAMDLSDTPLNAAEIILGGWGSENRFLGVGGPRNQLLLGNSVALRPEKAVGIRIAAPKTEVRGWKEDPKTGEMRRKPYVTSDGPCPNLFDSGGAMMIEDEKGEIRLIGVITTYGGGVWIGRFDGDERFPVRQATEEGAASLDSLPFQVAR